MLDTASAVAGLPDATATELKAVLDELQAIAGGATEGLNVVVVAGATAATNIAVTGIKTTDKLVGVVEAVIGLDTGTSAAGNKVSDVQDRLSIAAITSNGNIQLTGVDTTGHKLIVTWLDRTP